MKAFTQADAKNASRAGVDKEAIRTAQKIAPEHRKHIAAALRSRTGSISSESSAVGGASAG